VKGSVVFNHGKNSDALLNYNVILGKIQFIKNGTDTLAVTNPRDVKLFIAGTDRFIYDKIYYRILIATPKLILASHQFTKVLEVRKETGYGLASPTMAVDSYSTVTASDNSGIYKLKASAETLFSTSTDYYFGTGSNEFVIATQKNLMKLFPDKAEKIKGFVKENKLNFKKVADLGKLTEYVSTLPE
jgi:hypothetical protein